MISLNFRISLTKNLVSRFRSRFWIQNVCSKILRFSFLVKGKRHKDKPNQHYQIKGDQIVSAMQLKSFAFRKVNI